MGTAGLCGRQTGVWENPQDLLWVSQKDIVGPEAGEDDGLEEVGRGW